MAASTSRDDDWLDRRAVDWVRAGIVTQEQADAIRRFEHRADAAAPLDRLTIGAEVASYLGSVLALMGGAFVVGRRWDEFGIGGQITLACAIAIVGFAAGAWLGRLGEPGTSRLGSFMAAIGTAGVAMLVAVVADRAFDDSGWVVLAVGIAVVAVGLGLWRNRERPLQFLSTIVGFVLVMAGIGELVAVPTWAVSTALLTAGALLAIAGARGHLVPQEVVTIVGAVGAFVGALSLGEINRHLGPFVALVVAAALVVHALVGRRMPVLVVGVIGTLIATQALLTTTFSGAAASLVVALVGLAVVVAAMLRTQRRRSRQQARPGTV